MKMTRKIFNHYIKKLASDLRYVSKDPEKDKYFINTIFNIYEDYDSEIFGEMVEHLGSTCAFFPNRHEFDDAAIKFNPDHPANRDRGVYKEHTGEIDHERLKSVGIDSSEYDKPPATADEIAEIRNQFHFLKS